MKDKLLKQSSSFKKTLAKIRLNLITRMEPLWILDSVEQSSYSIKAKPNFPEFLSHCCTSFVVYSLQSSGKQGQLRSGMQYDAPQYCYSTVVRCRIHKVARFRKIVLSFE